MLLILALLSWKERQKSTQRFSPWFEMSASPFVVFSECDPP